MKEDSVRKQLDALKKKLGTWKAVAIHLGLSKQYLNHYLKGDKEPGRKLLRALGFDTVKRYVRA